MAWNRRKPRPVVNPRPASDAEILAWLMTQGYVVYSEKGWGVTLPGLRFIASKPPYFVTRYIPSNWDDDDPRRAHQGNGEAGPDEAARQVLQFHAGAERDGRSVFGLPALRERSLHSNRDEGSGEKANPEAGDNDGQNT